MSKIRVIQHAACETLGTIADALSREDLSFQSIRTFESEPVPKTIGEAAGLIVMGGPMGVYEQERYPFLRDEIRLIEEALKNDKPILGVCLGSQLLAAALGAKVHPGKQKEIGWHPVRLTPAAMKDLLWTGIDDSFIAYHWHGDVFELPSGAVPLASSDLTECQAFRHGRHAYGFLFHMEVTQKIIEDMVRSFSNELRSEGIEGREIIEKARSHLAPLQRIGRSVFGRWADGVTGQWSVS